MIDYIEEMMEITGVEKKRCPNDVYDELCNKYENCDNAPHCRYYPDFTAEKQQDILKLIAIKQIGVSIYPKNYFAAGISFAILTSRYSSSAHVDIVNAIAELAILLMRNNELDKTKVKEILER